MRDELDQMLDEAIKSYAAVEPPPELPARILRQAQQEPAPRRNPWRLALAIALPLAATFALVLLFAGRMNLPEPPATVASQPPTPSIEITTPTRPPETLAAATREPVQAHRRVRKAAGRSSENGKSWARPLPAPYSKEELALLNFVQQHPKEAAEIAEAQKRNSIMTPPQPLTITPLKTEPITIAALN